MQTHDRQLLPDADPQKSGRQSAGIPHSAAIILLWLFLTIALQALTTLPLLASGTIICAITLALSPSRFYTLLRRTRWIMFSLLLIYGYVTPGTALWENAGTWSPTQEGLLDGALQLCRLAAALAGLSIVLSLLTRQQLVGGIYVLVYPLQFLGITRERIAVRLALTLHYAETAMLEAACGWRKNITHMLEPQQTAHSEVELHAAPLALRDLLLIAAGGTLLAWVLL